MIYPITGPVIFSICVDKKLVTHGFVCLLQKIIASLQEPDYTKETVKAGTEYLKEFVIEQEQQVNSGKTCFMAKLLQHVSAGEPGARAGAGAGGGGGG